MFTPPARQSAKCIYTYNPMTLLLTLLLTKLLIMMVLTLVRTYAVTKFRILVHSVSAVLASEIAVKLTSTHQI